MSFNQIHHLCRQQFALHLTISIKRNQTRTQCPIQIAVSTPHAMACCWHKWCNNNALLFLAFHEKLQECCCCSSETVSSTFLKWDVLLKTNIGTNSSLRLDEIIDADIKHHSENKHFFSNHVTMNTYPFLLTTNSGINPPISNR